MDKIVAEIQDNIAVPGYNDKIVKDIAAFVLTITFSILRNISADLVNVKENK